MCIRDRTKGICTYYLSIGYTWFNLLITTVHFSTLSWQTRDVVEVGIVAGWWLSGSSLAIARSRFEPSHSHILARIDTGWPCDGFHPPSRALLRSTLLSPRSPLLLWRRCSFCGIPLPDSSVPSGMQLMRRQVNRQTVVNQPVVNQPSSLSIPFVMCRVTYTCAC